MDHSSLLCRTWNFTGHVSAKISLSPCSSGWPERYGRYFCARTQIRAGSVRKAFQLEAATVLAAGYLAFPMPFAWAHDAGTDVYVTSAMIKQLIPALIQEGLLK